MVAEMYAFSMQLADDQKASSLRRKHTTVTFVTHPSSTPSAGWKLQHLIVGCAHEPITYIHGRSTSKVTTVEELLCIIDDVLGVCSDLKTIEVLYSTEQVMHEYLAVARAQIRRWMLKLRDRVRLTPYDALQESNMRVEVGDGEFTIKPFEDLWKSNWIYEL